MQSTKLGGDEEEVPEDVYGGVDQGGGEDGVGFAPGPTVEEAGDGGEEDVAPVGEVQIGDVGEAEEDRGGEPACRVAVGGAGKKILQQAAEKAVHGAINSHLMEAVRQAITKIDDVCAASASQMQVKPARRPLENGSWNSHTPITNCRVGLRYCRMKLSSR